MGTPMGLHPAASSLTSLANSYDLKDVQFLHKGANIKHATEISPPPAQVVIQNFPTNVLASADETWSIVQWLPYGKAWKIVGWDALHWMVLPKHFSQLQDEDGKVGLLIRGYH